MINKKYMAIKDFFVIFAPDFKISTEIKKEKI